LIATRELEAAGRGLSKDGDYWRLGADWIAADARHDGPAGRAPPHRACAAQRLAKGPAQLRGRRAGPWFDLQKSERSGWRRQTLWVNPRPLYATTVRVPAPKQMSGPRPKCHQTRVRCGQEPGGRRKPKPGLPTAMLVDSGSPSRWHRAADPLQGPNAANRDPMVFCRHPLHMADPGRPARGRDPKWSRAGVDAGGPCPDCRASTLLARVRLVTTGAAGPIASMCQCESRLI
jgi:hypothetical protein